MTIELRKLSKEHLTEFKRDMQKAFQAGAVEEFGKIDVEILPESDIDRSLNTAGAAAYEAVVSEKMVGGAVVVIDESTQHNHLDFLYVKKGGQNEGVGQAIWAEIERLYPKTRIWETCTPYFERRNIHFYVNKCGFHIVEYYNRCHPEPEYPAKGEQMPDIDYFSDFFRFEKVMK